MQRVGPLITPRQERLLFVRCEPSADAVLLRQPSETHEDVRAVVEEHDILEHEVSGARAIDLDRQFHVDLPLGRHLSIGRADDGGVGSLRAREYVAVVRRSVHRRARVAHRHTRCGLGAKVVERDGVTQHAL